MTECIHITQGDITHQNVDAIVNAANSTLLGGGGVDGAIHDAAGPGLLEECKGLGGCPTGQARITSGYRLKARHVIHTVGPIWSGGSQGEDDLLASCYKNSLELASQNGFTTVAFPSISTGVYRFPIERAARIAATQIHAFLEGHPLPGQVTMVCFSQHDLQVYANALFAVSC